MQDVSKPSEPGELHLAMYQINPSQAKLSLSLAKESVSDTGRNETRKCYPLQDLRGTVNLCHLDFRVLTSRLRLELSRATGLGSFEGRYGSRAT